MSTTNKTEWHKEHFKTNKTPNKITICLQTHRVTWLKSVGSKFFMIPKNESALAGTNRLVKDSSRKSGSIQERSLSKLATCVHQQQFYVQVVPLDILLFTSWISSSTRADLTCYSSFGRTVSSHCTLLCWTVPSHLQSEQLHSCSCALKNWFTQR